MGDLLVYIAPYLLVLTLVVTVHELGHFLVARGFGMAIDRFSIGFGPTLVRWRDRGGVEWRVGCIPLGGYVRFAGQEPVSTVPDETGLADVRRQAEAQGRGAALSRFYDFRPVWERAAVAAAGPAANFLMSIIIFAGVLWGLGATLTLPRIGGVVPQSPADRAGLKTGDLVTALDGRAVNEFSDIASAVQYRAGSPIRVSVRRATPTGLANLDLMATPEVRTTPEPFTGRPVRGTVLGVYSSRDPADYKRVRYSASQAVALGVKQVGDIIGATAVYLGRIVRGLESGDQLRGPVGMARASGAITKAALHAQPTPGGKLEGGALVLLQLAAVLSVGIGFMNLLPIPVLDGGHLVFYAYEALARRPVSAAVQAASLRVGLVLILGLMLFATWNDLRQFDLLRILGRLFS